MENLNELSEISTIINQTTKNREIYNMLTNIERYKQSIPVSPRLNQFIENRITILESEGYKFNYTDEDDFDESNIEATFNRHLTLFRSQKTLNIWKGSSNCTIFGNPEINHKFRAWHDYIHLSTNLGYDMIDETIVGDIQKNELPQHWEIERRLIHVEVTGQVQYYHKHNDFVQNQRLFTRDYILNPLKALNTKY